MKGSPDIAEGFFLGYSPDESWDCAQIQNRQGPEFMKEGSAQWPNSAGRVTAPLPAFLRKEIVGSAEYQEDEAL